MYSEHDLEKLQVWLKKASAQPHDSSILSALDRQKTGGTFFCWQVDFKPSAEASVPSFFSLHPSCDLFTD